MGNQPLAAPNIFRLLAKERRCVQRAQARVFHAAPVEVLHAYLVVLGPRIRHTDFLLEILHALLGLTKRIRRIGEIRRRSPEGHAQLAVLLLQPLKIARN